MRALSASAVLSLVVALPMGAAPRFAMTPAAEAASPAPPDPNRILGRTAFYTPFISLSTTEVEFVVDEGDDPADQTVRLRNLGTGTLQWEASEDVDWLKLKPKDGKLSFLQSKDLKLEVDSEDLPPGEYQATVTITGNASNSPRTIDVRLTVLPGPTIGLSPTALSFNVAEGENPADQNITISNTGGGTLDWTAEDDASWLSVTPTSGSLSSGVSQVVRASVESADLEPGEYTATITIKGNGVNAPQIVDVTLTVVGHPVIGLSTSQLSSSVEEGSDPADQTVTVTNTGGGTLNWVVSDDADWLSAAPTAGNLAAGASAGVTVSIATAGLAPGTYAATLTFDGNGENAPQQVAVSLTITARPAIGLSTASLAFAGQEGTDPTDQPVTVTNTGGGTLNWVVSDDADWLSAAPASGSLVAGASAEVTVSVATAGLAPGTYAATLTFDGNGENAPQQVAVDLTITRRPAMTVTPPNLDFAVQEGEDPADRVVTVTNSGGGTLNWTVSDDADWLSVAPTSGSLAAGASAEVTVSVAAAALAPGDYTATLTFDGNGANAPQTVAVSLTVTDRPALAVTPVSLEIGVEEGNDPADRTLSISNPGGGTLDWVVSDDADWLSVAPTSGSLAAGASAEVTVSVAAADLAPGDYTATLTFDGNGENAPQTVAVSLTVAQGPILDVSTTSLEFAAEEGDDPPNQVVTVANTGGGMLGWDASGDAEWLSAEPTSGSLAGGASEDVAVSVVAADLAPGDYTATLTFDGNGKNAPQTVTVNLSVTPPPTIGVSTTSLEFITDDGDDPAEQTVTITNQGGGILGWQASADAPWLSLAPTSGSLAAGASQEVTVSATTQELGPGMHTATVTLTGGTASRTIEVGLEVRLTVSMGQLVRALAGDRVLDANEIGFLDAMGNGNGRFDLGDFLAWLESRGSSAPTTTATTPQAAVPAESDSSGDAGGKRADRQQTVGRP